MLKNILLISILLSSGSVEAMSCGGRFPNPITDVCWKCLFPIYIGPVPITFGETPTLDAPPPLICTCPAPPPLFIRIGLGISFWEPARVAEAVRTPFCFPTLGGTVISGLPFKNGMNSARDGRTGNAFYHVHWIQYPVLNWLGMAITTGACFISETFDVGYISEVDPLWDDDELSFILNPEAVLFANPIAQLACAADSVAAATTNFGLDALFWCAGSQGSVYPLDGMVGNHEGGINSSLLVVHRMIYKLHRLGLGMDTSTPMAMCMSLPQPILRKKQYKQQIMYPIPNPFSGHGLGKTSVIWGAGKEFPYKGEDFSYLVWRKRTCCAF